MANAVPTMPSRPLRPIGWGMAILVGAALTVQFTHTGIDIFLVLVAGFVLLVLERTLGDWIAESLGPPATVLVFALLASLAVLYAVSAEGKARANRFFAIAESRGYHPLYFVVEDPSETKDDKTAKGRGADAVAAATAGRAAPPAGTGDSSPASGAASGVAVSPGIFSWGSSPDRSKHLRLRAEPDVVSGGQPVTLRATLESDPSKDTPKDTPTTALTVIFTVNGGVVAKVPFDAAGNASAQFTTEVPGQYTARSRMSGSMFGQEVSATFNVLPASARPVRKR
jgi:hypothetical protein